MDNPYIRDLDKYTRALLSVLGRGRQAEKPDEDLLTLIELHDDMPGDLKALLFTWAYRPWNSLDVGKWQLRAKWVKYVDRVLDEYYQDGEIDKERALAIGAHGYGPPLVATWEAGATRMSLVALDVSDGIIEQLGSVGEWVESAREEIESDCGDISEDFGSLLEKIDGGE